APSATVMTNASGPGDAAHVGSFDEVGDQAKNELSREHLVFSVAGGPSLPLQTDMCRDNEGLRKIIRRS
ncbi:MAG: hypothetical protein ABWX83_05615, partial [Luteibacter sp.]